MPAVPERALGITPRSPKLTGRFFDCLMCQSHVPFSREAQITPTGVDLSLSFEREWGRNSPLDCEVGFWEWRVRG